MPSTKITEHDMEDSVFEKLLEGVGFKTPSKIEKIDPDSTKTITKTGKGKLFINGNGSSITLVIDGVTVCDNLYTFATFEVEFTESFSMTRGNTTTDVIAVAVFY